MNELIYINKANKREIISMFIKNHNINIYEPEKI